MSKIVKAVKRAKETRNADQAHVQRQQAMGQFRMQGEPFAYTQTKVVPLDRSHLENQRLMTLVGDPGALDAYNLLRTQILQRTRDKGQNTLMITSVWDGEGKTVTAINLAASIAREVQQTVLLVDGDFRNPGIHHYLGFEPAKGLSDYFREDIPVADLLINPDLDKMVVLPAGEPLFGSTEVLGSPKMEQLVKEMKRRYPERYVIYDCPPLLSAPDALVFSSYVDGVILVVEAGKTSRDDIKKAVNLLEGKNILGLVMNKAQGEQRA